MENDVFMLIFNQYLCKKIDVNSITILDKLAWKMIGTCWNYPLLK